MDNEKKELTMDELKSTITATLEESPLAKKMADIEKGLSALQSVPTDKKAAEIEVAAKFVKDLCDGKLESERKTITTGSGSFGYTVPTELESSVHEAKDKLAKIRANAFVFKMDGKYQLPVEGTGVTAYWVTTEADSDITESNPTVGKKDLDDQYLASRVRIPYKLLQTSAINIVEFVSRLSARALVSAEETAFVGGDGSGKPTGIRQASITAVPQAGANLAYDDLVNLYYAVPEQYRVNGKWLFSTAALKLARKLKDTISLPIFNVTDNSIFGKEVLECTDIPENLGSGANETEIYFGDLKEYWIKDGQTMLAEAKSVTGRLQIDLFMYQSVDGVVVNTEAFRKGTGIK
jgi:HK97 family phage major capsid protein